MSDADALFNQAAAALNDGRRDEAATLLTQLLALAPHDVEAALILAKLLAERGAPLEEIEPALRTAAPAEPAWCWGLLGMMRQGVQRWADAADAYDAAMAHQTSPELHLNRANCRRRAGRLSEAAEDYAAAIDVADVRSVRDGWRDLINDLARAERWGDALAQAARLAPYDPLLAEALAPDPTPAEIDAVITRIEQALAAPAVVPAFIPPEPHTEARGARVLMLFTARRGGDPLGIPTELPPMLALSAAAAGLIAQHIDVDPLFAPQLHSPAERADADAAIRNALAQRPEMVIIDANSPSRLGLWTPATLAAAVHAGGGKLLAFCPDDWAGYSTSVWSHVADAAWLEEPIEALDPRRLGAWPPSAFGFPARPAAAPRDITALFSGSATADRGAWLARMAGADPGWDIRLQSFGVGAPREAMAATMGRAHAVVNFGRRPDDSMILTGRTMEAIAAGALLLEQCASRLDRLLTPWRGFIPFQSWTDLAAARHAIERRPDLAVAVAASAQATLAQYFSPAAYWAIATRALGLGESRLR